MLSPGGTQTSLVMGPARALFQYDLCPPSMGGTFQIGAHGASYRYEVTLAFPHGTAAKSWLTEQLLSQSGIVGEPTSAEYNALPRPKR